MVGFHSYSMSTFTRGYPPWLRKPSFSSKGFQASNQNHGRYIMAGGCSILGSAVTVRLSNSNLFLKRTSEIQESFKINIHQSIQLYHNAFTYNHLFFVHHSKQKTHHGWRFFLPGGSLWKGSSPWCSDVGSGDLQWDIKGIHIYIYIYIHIHYVYTYTSIWDILYVYTYFPVHIVDDEWITHRISEHLKSSS